MAINPTPIKCQHNKKAKVWLKLKTSLEFQLKKERKRNKKMSKSLHKMSRMSLLRDKLTKSINLSCIGKTTNRRPNK